MELLLFAMMKEKTDLLNSTRQIQKDSLLAEGKKLCRGGH